MKITEHCDPLPIRSEIQFGIYTMLLNIICIDIIITITTTTTLRVLRRIELVWKKEKGKEENTV